MVLILFGLFQAVPVQSLIGGTLAGDTVSRTDWNAKLAEASSSVYLIEAQKCDGTPLRQGTGFLSENWLVTNAHVIENASRIFISNPSGKQFEASRWSLDDSIDLAIISFDNASGSQLKLASNNPTEGALVGTVGHPLGGPIQIRDGRVLNYVDGEEHGREGALYLGLTSEALPGDSGGPVIGSTGQVLGVTSAVLREDNLTLAIPVERLAVYLADSAKYTFTSPCE